MKMSIERTSETESLGDLSPSDLQYLFEGHCVLSFIFPDESIIESVSTLNQDTLEMYGLGSMDGLYDLEERRPIPDRMIPWLRSIRPGKTKVLTPLDSFFEIGGKLGW